MRLTKNLFYKQCNIQDKQDTVNKNKGRRLNKKKKKKNPKKLINLIPNNDFF